MSSKMETEALMDNQHHQGRLGTPDANNTASYMSSDSNKQHYEQRSTQGTSQQQTADSFGTNVQDLFSQLQIALALEPKYQPNLFLPLQSNVSTKNHFSFFAKR